MNYKTLPFLALMLGIMFFAPYGFAQAGGGGWTGDAVCGNGTVESPEACDDGNMVGGDGCSSICALETGGGTGGGTSGPVCGNGSIESGEACDDGNTVNGDGCSSVCAVESAPSPSCSPNGTTIGQMPMATYALTLYEEQACCSGEAVYGGQYGRNKVCWPDAAYAPSEGDWVDMGCGQISNAYNASCNPTQEWLDITCNEGEMLQGRSVTGLGCEPPNSYFKEQRRCVASNACPVTQTAPTASLSANPVSIIQGNSSALSWSSANADVCVGTGFDTLGALSGMVNVSPQTTTGYGLTCSRSAGTAGTWTYTTSDTSDFACPLTDLSRGYRNVPDCPSANPGGTSCSASSSACKVNSASGCNVNTDLYTCTGASPAPSASASATVAVTPSPVDLTAMNYTPAWGSSVSAGLITFTAGATNLGTAAANGFSNMFELGDGTLFAASSASAAPGATATFTASRTISTPGTYQYRGCADLNTSWTGSVAESDEGNNCSPWTTFTVTAPTPAPISCSFSSNPSPLVGGASATFTWSSTNADTCTGNGFNTGGARSGTSGTVTTVPGNTYQLMCTSSSGAAPCTSQITASSPVAYITATPSRVKSGGTAVVSWSAANVTSCTVSGTDGYASGVLAGPTVATSTSNVSRTITKQTIFTISCDGAAAQDTVVVNLVPVFDEF